VCPCVCVHDLTHINKVARSLAHTHTSNVYTNTKGLAGVALDIRDELLSFEYLRPFFLFILGIRAEHHQHQR
jgi:hypothetical protein